MEIFNTAVMAFFLKWFYTCQLIELMVVGLLVWWFMKNLDANQFHFLYTVCWQAITGMMKDEPVISVHIQQINY